MSPRLDSDKLLLAGILLLALLVRIYNFGELSLGNDELSVLARIQYDNFSDLIEKGVKEDVHPAGIQVFAYYWTAIFGESAFSLRFPFIICGLLGILGIYFLGKNWFGVETALFTALFMAATQYFIVLGVYARPYAVVLAASAWMIYAWDKLIFYENKIRHYIGFVLGATLCLYFHYFSYLLIGVVCISGIFILSREKLKPYLLSLGLILILYTPHLGIFFHHLSKGGSEWIGRPGLTFFWDYFAYAFQYSWSSITVCGSILVMAYIISKKIKVRNTHKSRYRTLALIFFLFPICLGLLYSIYKAPVLHANGLQASYPYFLLFIFSFLPKMERGKKAALIFIMSLFLLQALIFNRKHFQLFYNRSAEFLSQEILKIEETQQDLKTLHLLQLHDPYYADYYFRNVDTPPKIYTYEIEKLGGIKEWRELFSSIEIDQVSLGFLSKTLPPDFIPILREFYPVLSRRENRFISESYLFSKKDPQQIGPIWEFKEDFEREGSKWENSLDFRQNSLIYAGNSSAFMAKDKIFGPTLRLDLDKINLKPYQELWVRVPFWNQGLEKDIFLIVEAWEGTEQILRSSVSLSRFATKENSWNFVHFLARAQHLGLGKAGQNLKVYFWNPNQEELYFDDLELRIESGNPILYSLVEAIPPYIQ